MTQRKTVYLIDGTAYIHRAYHAIRGLSNADGLPTNAIFGFCRMILSLIAERSPAYLAMCFDAKGPTFRHERYADYKANRPPMPEDMAQQIPWIKSVTEAFRIPIFEMVGYEADDLIGTLARQAGAAGFDVIMVTGDKDFIQLVTETTEIWDPMKSVAIDLAAVQATHGVTPAQIIDVMGLSGDTADNVPGVPGVGPKTAVKLIQQFGSMDALYRQVGSLPKGKQRQNLIEHREQAFLSRELVTIRTDAPVAFEPERLAVQDPDRDALGTLFQKLEFRQLQQQYAAVADRRPRQYTAVTDMTALNALIEKIAAADIVAVDTETTSRDPMRAELVGVSVAMVPDTAYYVPCGHDPDVVPETLDRGQVLDALRPVLEDPSIRKVGQNIKYDWMVLSRHGIDLAGVAFDTMLASYLLNPSKRSHGLDQIALDLFGHKMIAFKDVAGTGKSAITFDRVPLDTAVPYACEDADMTLQAYLRLRDDLDRAGLTDLLETVEMPLVPVLMRMERCGIAVDRERLTELSETFSRQLEQLESEIHTLAGEPFNIQSSQQLGQILFDKLGLPTQKKTRKRTGHSTDVEVLQALAPLHPLPERVLRHRTLAKLKSTYTDALLELIHPETGRIHTSFNQTVAATGRLSSSDPNLQNIPVRTEEGRQIRSAFVPRAGWHLVSADYSQIELRLLAHVSGDPILIQAFEDNEDIHSRTAAEVFQVFPEMLTDELRRQAKVINFGIIYGMSPFGLAKSLGISQTMAKTYIDHYFRRYRGVSEYIDRTIALARKDKKTSTLLGRVRLLPDIDSANRNIRQFAERTAVNTPIQGTAADLIKLAMIRVDAAFAEGAMQSAMLLSVHDEIVFESPPDELDAAMTMVSDIMESVWDLKVPLKVNMASGADWSVIH